MTCDEDLIKNHIPQYILLKAIGVFLIVLFFVSCISGFFLLDKIENNYIWQHSKEDLRESFELNLYILSFFAALVLLATFLLEDRVAVILYKILLGLFLIGLGQFIGFNVTCYQLNSIIDPFPRHKAYIPEGSIVSIRNDKGVCDNLCKSLIFRGFYGVSLIESSKYSENTPKKTFVFSANENCIAKTIEDARGRLFKDIDSCFVSMDPGAKFDERRRYRLLWEDLDNVGIFHRMYMTRNVLEEMKTGEQWVNVEILFERPFFIRPIWTYFSPALQVRTPYLKMLHYQRADVKEEK